MMCVARSQPLGRPVRVGLIGCGAQGQVMASTSQGYGYFGGGHGPAYVEGVRLESWPDDGSAEWTELFERAQKHPVRARWEERKG